MTRYITIRRTLPWIFGFFAALALGAAPAAAQQCNGTDCTLSTTCPGNVCEVGETESFTLSCTIEIPGEDCPFPQIEPCCDEFLLFPLDNAWYNGEMKENGQWVVDADCAQASNPLVHTFQESEIGEYRRQACTSSSCTVCSPWMDYEVVDD